MNVLSREEQLSVLHLLVEGDSLRSIIDAYPVICIGNPDENRICTSHAERANLTMRMTIRRLTRLTNAHSKKWENHEAALGLYFGFYNFCRVHQTLRCTPAVQAGLAAQTWSVAELLENAVDLR